MAARMILLELLGLAIVAFTIWMIYSSKKRERADRQCRGCKRKAYLASPDNCCPDCGVNHDLIEEKGFPL